MMKFVCSQPTTRYYAWQVEVMLNNFLHYGVSPEQIHIVSAYVGSPSLEWYKLEKHFKNVNFFFYPDTRVDQTYVSSIRPNTLKKHFKQFPELVDDTIFYHDCDILLTNPFNYEKFIKDDIWYLSDTTSYISSEYIKSKGYNIFEEMCKIIDIPPKEVIRRERISGGSGGAQYIMKNITHLFWHKVEIDSTLLFKYFINKAEQCDKQDYHSIQMWTADMWAVLWNAWLFGHKTIVHEDLNFAWPSQSYDAIDRLNLYHNSGVTEEQQRFFRKTDFKYRLPYGADLTVSDRVSNYFYWEWVQKTAKNSCLIGENNES